MKLEGAFALGMAAVTARSPEALTLSQPPILCHWSQPLELVLFVPPKNAPEWRRAPELTGEGLSLPIKQSEQNLPALHLHRLGIRSARGSHKTFSKPTAGS